MRQAVIPRYGDPDVFEIRESSDPVPGDGQIRIRVRATGVNFADILARIGLYPDAPKPPVVVGYEVAGVVDAVGHGVANPHEGDRVVALTRFGGYADCVVVPASQAYRFPDRLSDAEAAAVPVTYLTAALALYKIAALTAGETVLVHNAGGGWGLRPRSSRAFAARRSSARPRPASTTRFAASASSTRSTIAPPTSRRK
ncbi:MAG TPA: alcohol dehydrogenase catalytic domain-containing protein [Vicinamibacterales bacterium]